MHLTENQIKILKQFQGNYEWCYTFAHFDDLGMDRKQLSKEFKSLRDLELVTFERGLMDDDGMVAGSGYALNYKKREVIDNICKTPIKDDWMFRFDSRFDYLRKDDSHAIKQFIQTLLNTKENQHEQK